ncbi:hypothetical protein GCM10010472_10820 [Pseudonocardia halophobica]|uniref:Uncharacterized protein n=1 Tax=Pseudonocardia halophobica TaxID=29401 RepID=A0A9W6NY21_9PSEU|nr:phage gp6-like head-tail connector protein [Pseudonocardia halophobica]GLL13469.1 hypothetical protein GCM10017577_46130 [Pseudonocardia halophobica]
MAWNPDYCTVGELCDYLRVGDTADDGQIALAISAASRAVDNTCRRQFGIDDVAKPRVYTARVDEHGRHVVDVDDTMYVPGDGTYPPSYPPFFPSTGTVPIVVAADFAGDGGFATTITSWSWGPSNAPMSGRPWTQLVSRQALPLRPDAVRITSRWGWTEFPEAIRQATLMQAARFHARRDAPFGVAGSPETGSELRLLAKVDPDVAVLLQPFTRKWWTA